MQTLIERLFKRKSKPVADKRIKYRRQKFDYDCGQTCLDMLGYNGYKIFPKPNGLTQDKVAEIFGHKSEEIISIEFSEQTYFDTPHFITVNTMAAWGWHNVIGYKDQIYCPSLGIFKIQDYKKYLWWGTGFPIPFAEDSNLNQTTGFTSCN
jgi:hypothetical protein